jgi:hypothetical protein
MMDLDAILDAIAYSTGGVVRIPEKYIGQLNACYGTKWKPSDMDDLTKARALGRLYLNHYARPSVIGRMPTPEDAVRIWFGGPIGHLREFTRWHWLRVQPHLPNERVYNSDAGVGGAECSR